MFELEKDLIIKLREKRARKKMTILAASKEIGISSKTLSLIENEKNNRVKKGVYEKLISWLVSKEEY